jgi:hypothetical protein
MGRLARRKSNLIPYEREGRWCLASLRPLSRVRQRLSGPTWVDTCCCAHPGQGDRPDTPGILAFEPFELAIVAVHAVQLADRATATSLAALGGMRL